MVVTICQHRYMAKAQVEPKSAPQPPPVAPEKPFPVLVSTGLSYLGDGLYAVFRMETQGERVVSARIEKRNVDLLTGLAVKADLDGLEKWGRK